MGARTAASSLQAGLGFLSALQWCWVGFRDGVMNCGLEGWQVDMGLSFIILILILLIKLFITKDVLILGESEEVIWRLFYDLLLATPRVRVELQVILVQVLVELEEGGLVVAAVAVVGRAEDRADIVIMLELVSLVHELVGPRHHLQVVCVVELFCYVLSGGISTAPKRKPAPRGLSLNPTAASSGSLHKRSDPAPLSGTS